MHLKTVLHLAWLGVAVAACSVAEDPVVGVEAREAAPAPTVAVAPATVGTTTTSQVTSTTTTSTTSTTTTMAPTTTTTTTTTLPPTDELELHLLETIYGDISPKSIVASGDGLFFAQNMMYRHTITVYDEDYQLVTTIDDSVTLSDYGIDGFEGTFQGAPVEAAFTSDGAFAYVSNYQMYGRGFDRPGGDGCNDAGYDESFLYRIDTAALAIDQVIPVGAVPKYVAVTPDDDLVLVTNWCSFDLSIVDTTRGVEVTRLELGRHPRGIAISPDGSTAYVAVMGGRDIAVVSLEDLTVSWLENVGSNPRHLVLDPAGAHLYATLNGDGRVIKIDVATGEVTGSVATGSAPRSMAISSDGASLYVVNYNSDTLSKVLTNEMVEVQELAVNDKPIGITYDGRTGNVWVSNYSGSIMVFGER